MAAESQNIEWKESWNDDYLKWICGFANAQGGKIYIGINDKGNVKGIPNAKKLMDDIPNKTINHLGIVVDVNLHTKSGNDYLEIIVEAYPNPISFKGEYHYRSGSTKQILKGSALMKFLLQKQGKRWDGVPVPNISVRSLDSSTFNYFKKKSRETGRLSPEALKGSLDVLLENLRLKADTENMKRAAVLLFHPDPEKYVTGAFVKIGFFNNDTDLAYQDEVHGNLFQQVEKTMDLLLTKYLKAYISYKGIHRIEKYQVPETALREAVLNAIAHKDYSGGTAIQISVYNDKIILWNEGELPEDWTIKDLKTKHASKPFNPDIANAFYWAGLIEAWGRGTLKIIKACKEHGIKPPLFRYIQSGFVVEFRFIPPKQVHITGIPELSTEEKILSILKENNKVTIAEIYEVTRIPIRTIERTIKALRESKRIERIGSKKSGVWKVID